MRFAYIDSNGNEVPIPSVDALALRIELGAINEDTELYDAQADQWGPAHTHEIFHTLSRAAEEGDQGFVAPPPPVAPPPGQQPEPAAEEPAAAAEAEPAAEPTAEQEDNGLTLTDAPAAPADEPPADDTGLGDLDLDLAPALETEPQDAEADAPLDLAPAVDAPPADEALLDITDADETPLDLSPAADAPLDLADDSSLDAPAPTGMPLAMSPADDLAASGEQQETPAFDFGDMEGGLELEQEFSGPDAGDAEPAMDFSMDVDSGGDFGAGLEQPMDFSSEGFGDTGGGALDLEQPMSEFTPDAPPSWMEGDDEAADDDVMDFSSVSSAAADDEAGEDGEKRERRTPRSKPSPPKLRRQRSLVGPIVGVALLLGVGVGGYVAWPIISEQLASGGEPDEPLVVLPDIDPELLPQMRSVAGAAFASVVRDARASADPGLASPNNDRLSGVYLSSASQFADVETFWLGVQDVLAEVRTVDLQSFHAHYEREMGTAGVASENTAIMAERADSGFVAAAEAREELYGLVEGVIGAALELHTFLEANEDRIEYAPASTTTTDPIFEVRSDQAILDNMSELLAGVTDALDALDYLDLVTADGFWNAVAARFEEVGVE